MREDLLQALEREYEDQRRKNEHTEETRKAEIIDHFPEIQVLVKSREQLIFGTLQQILRGEAEADMLPERMEKLNGEIRQKLKEAGFAEDYLAPVYRCPVCQDTGYTGEVIKEPCACLIKAYQEKIRNEIGLTDGKKETFENYDSDMIPNTMIPNIGMTQRKLTDLIRRQCEQWADYYPETRIRDILMTGKSGLGKTFLLHAMANRLIERGFHVLIVSAFNFLQMARKSYFEGDNTLEELLAAPILMLDDLGSEPLMKNITVEMLFNLINERQDQNRSTIISSNLNMNEIRERYTERIASRLSPSERCMVFTLDGEDLRKVERET